MTEFQLGCHQHIKNLNHIYSYEVMLFKCYASPKYICGMVLRCFWTSYIPACLKLIVEFSYKLLRNDLGHIDNWLECVTYTEYL